MYVKCNSIKAPAGKQIGRMYFVFYYSTAINLKHDFSIVSGAYDDVKNCKMTASV